MVRSREEAAQLAENTHNNRPGTCQLWVRTLFDVPSAGDVDHDGDADAVDGWLKEPDKAKHVGDRNPPRGVPVAFKGGSHGFGHRAISLGDGRIRSTDMDPTRYHAGSTGTTTIRQIEISMNQEYLGWSETMSGVLIPGGPKPKKTRGPKVDHAIADLKLATGNGERGDLIASALKTLQKVKYL